MKNTDDMGTFQNKILSTKIDSRFIGLLLLVTPVLLPTYDGLAVLIGSRNATTFLSAAFAWRYVCWAIYAILFGMSLVRDVRSKIVAIPFLLLILSVLYSSLYNGYGLRNSLSDLMPIVMTIILTITFSGREFQRYLKALYVWISILMIINSACMLRYYPGGMYNAGFMGTNDNYYLFGLDNVCFLYALAGCSIGLLYRSTVNRIGILLPMIYAIVFFPYYIARAGTAMAVVTVLPFLIFLAGRSFSTRILNYKYVLIASLVLFFAICVLNTLGVFEGLLELIGKDATFSNRTYIWRAVIRSMKGHELLGYGLSLDLMHTVLSMASGGYYSLYMSQIGHVHNVLLEFYFRSGLVGFVLFLFCLLAPYKRMAALKGTYTARLMCVLFFLLWITHMFEFRTSEILFWIIPLCLYRVNDIHNLSCNSMC